MSLVPPSAPAGRRRRLPPPARRRTATRRRGALAALAALVSAVALATSVVTAAPASAHDRLTGSSPADGATVASTPDRLVLTFEEAPVTVGLAVRVTGPTGDVQSGAPRVEGSELVQDLLPAAPAGSYRVVWRVTADDGHPVSGSFGFTSGVADTRTPTATPLAPETPGASGPPGSTTQTLPAGHAAGTTAVPDLGVPAPAATTTAGAVVVRVVVVVVVLAALLALLVLLRRRRSSPASRP